MSLGCHNGGRFADYHAPNDPNIQSYDDAYSYLVRNPDEFHLEDAVRIYTFDVALRKRIKREERRNGNQPLDQAGIDRVVQQSYGSTELEDIKLKAAQTILEYKSVSNAQAVLEFASKIDKPKRTGFLKLTAVGAWQGFAGNILTSFFVVAIAVYAYLYQDREQIKDIAQYLNRCVLFRGNGPSQNGGG